MIMDRKMYFDIKDEIERLRKEATALKENSDHYFSMKDLFIVQYSPYSNEVAKARSKADLNIDVFRGQLRENGFALKGILNTSLYGALNTEGGNEVKIEGISMKTNINILKYISLNEVFMLQEKKNYDNLASIDDINEAIIFAIENCDDLDFFPMEGRNKLLSKNRV